MIKLFQTFALIVLISGTALCQSNNESINQAVTFFKSNNFLAAIEVLEKTIPQIQSQQVDSLTYCDAVNLLATCYVKANKNELAIEWLRKTTKDCNQPKPQIKKNYVSAFLNLAQLLFKTKNYTEALSIWEEACFIAKTNYGEKSQVYLNLLNSYPSIFLGIKNYQGAEAKYVEIINLKAQILGENSSEVIQTKNALGNFYLNQNKPILAEKIFLEIVAVKQDTINKLFSQGYANSLINLGKVYTKTNDISKADSVSKIASRVYSNLNSNQTKSKEYLQLLEIQAYILNNTERYFEAEKIYKILKNIQNPNSIDYLTTISNLASLYRKMGRVLDAEPLYDKALIICKEKIGENSYEYANLINNLGLLYDDMGKFEKAEKLYVKSLELAEKYSGIESNEYATTLDNLGILFKNTGRLTESESYFSKSLNIRKKTLGPQSIEYATSCNNLGSIFQATGRFNEAEPLYLKAAEILKSKFGDDNIIYAGTINNLASLYETKENLAIALPLYQESLRIYKLKLGESHPDYISTMNNLALLSEKQGDFKSAEILFKTNAYKAQIQLGKNHPTYATILSNLGALYEHKAYYKKTDSLYSLVLSIRNNSLPARHPDITLTKFNLARLKTATKKYVEADTNWNQSLNSYLYQIKTFFPSMSEKEKGEFYGLIKSKFDNFNSYGILRYKSNPSVLSSMYNYQLETKALLLNTSNKIRERILNSGDSILINKYKSWINFKNQLASYHNLSKNEVTALNINIDSLENLANQSEKELSNSSEIFNKNISTKPLKWQDVQKVLLPKEAAIEIIRFAYFKFDSAGIYSDSVIYAALIIKKDTKENPEIVLLPNGNELENKFLKVYRNSIRFKTEDMNSYAQFWGKIKENLKGIEKVYVSPDGIYNLININALFNPITNTYAFEELEIRNVTNTKDLLSNYKSDFKTNAIIIGDPEFYTNSRNENINEPIAKLPGTRIEVNQINELLTQNKISCEVFTDKKAAEEVLKLTSNPYILHIATHGFFEKDSENKDLKNSKSINNPLLRSGLLMAGSGNTLENRKNTKDSDKSQNTKSKEDGIFTAYEAMNLNLDKTELVILSACETGLGEIKNGEGVYGLQRSIKIAGAKSIIISLWKVNDATTQKLMNTFYSEFLVSNDKNKAFRIAQQNIKKEFGHPYYWGAFMLIGN